MSQASLFESGLQILLDDAQGRIEYLPDVIDARTAQHWFDALQREIDWRSGRRLMYEREVDVPRLRAHFRGDDPQLPPVLSDALALARARVPAPFDSIGLNLYRDEHDSVAPHNDKLDEIVRGAPIVLLSLGATRRMTIRAKQPPARVLHLDLEAGSLLTMSWTTQLHFDHGIPKQRMKSAPRISLAFRVRGESQRT